MKIRSWYEEHPLRFALIAGILLRLIAVFFSKGFGMHDDHFLVIEAAQSWVDGTDYNNWLPGSGNTQPSGHSFFYCGLHFLLFHFLEWIGIFDPQTKMWVVRLLHAIASLGVIYYGFRITNKLAGREPASLAALLIAVLWFMPFMSVRNLVEVACIPFLAAGTWFVIKADDEKQSNRLLILGGVALGLAFCIRFQSLFFVAGTGFALLLLRRWKAAFITGAAALVPFGLIQGIVDGVIWGRPFAEFAAYIQYNIDNAYNYIRNPWYSYLLLILGILVPPLSLLLFWGFLKSWKKQLIVFIPVMFFLAFHSYFPNKQERFILPIVPFIVMMGISGLHAILERHPDPSGFRKFVRGSWIFFWILNFILLPFITTMYSKKARVESMRYLSADKANIDYLLLEDTNHGTPKMPPEFYLGKWVSCYELSQEHPLDSLKAKFARYGPRYYPDYVLFFEDKNLDQRVATVKTLLPGMRYETTIQPGFIDKVLYMLNPKNANQVIYIYKVHG